MHAQAAVVQAETLRAYRGLLRGRYRVRPRTLHPWIRANSTSWSV